MTDPYKDALANKYKYLSTKCIASILKTLDRIRIKIDMTKNEMPDVEICVYYDFHNAINNANFTKDEENILNWYFLKDYTLEDSAWESNISIGQASKVKNIVLKKIYKALNGDS